LRGKLLDVSKWGAPSSKFSQSRTVSSNATCLTWPIVSRHRDGIAGQNRHSRQIAAGKHRDSGDTARDSTHQADDSGAMNRNRSPGCP